MWRRVRCEGCRKSKARDEARKQYRERAASQRRTVREFPPCIDCGVAIEPMVGSGRNRKRCAPCTKVYQRWYNTMYVRAIRAQAKLRRLVA